ncbi:hypothetical protein DVJ78_02375 [Humibacter sp. BT305]|nr:hypothetical protein DVJ78_02375 [Humibacter sp. BT305]
MSDDHVATATVQIRATPREVWAVLTEDDPFEHGGEVVLAEEPHRLVTTRVAPTSEEPVVAGESHTVSYVLEPIGDDRTRVVLTEDHQADEADRARAEADRTAALEALRAEVEKDIVTD